jgi:hypothetical protein
MKKPRIFTDTNFLITVIKFAGGIIISLLVFINTLQNNSINQKFDMIAKQIQKIEDQNKTFISFIMECKQDVTDLGNIIASHLGWHKGKDL